MRFDYDPHYDAEVISMGRCEACGEYCASYGGKLAGWLCVECWDDMGQWWAEWEREIDHVYG